MSDETKASQDDFEESLSRAAAEVKDQEVKEVEPEEVEEAAEEEVAPPEPDDNKERSQLGRKVKRLEDTIIELQRQLTQKMEAAKEEYDPEAIVTASDVDKLIELREKKLNEKKMQYQSSYGAQFIELTRGLDDATANEIEEEMLTNFNEIVTGDPRQDARINFLRAENNILKKKTGKKNPLKGEKPQGINTGTKVSSPNKPIKNLPPEALRFLEKEGLSMEWAEKALSK